MTSTVLVTGSSSGFGRAICRHFHANGWNVVASMRAPLSEVEFTTGDRMLVTRLDVQDRTSIDSAVAGAIEKFGSVDVVINNAGFGLYGAFEGIPREKLIEQFEVNVFGPMDVTRAILPHFRGRRSGVVVNVSSGVGVFAIPIASQYAASKFALEGFSEAISYELAAVGVTVKIVEPGAAPSTGFPARSESETKSLATPQDYESFLAGTQEVFKRFSTGADDGAIEKIAASIFEAATDGTDQLRYVLTEDIKPLIKARREAGEEQYMKTMRALFAI